MGISLEKRLLGVTGKELCDMNVARKMKQSIYQVYAELGLERGRLDRRIS
jgi:hypothetical protein